jgi:hypothetical protein
MKRLDFAIFSAACQSEKERRFVNIVATLDQKVGLDCLVFTENPRLLSATNTGDFEKKWPAELQPL